MILTSIIPKKDKSRAYARAQPAKVMKDGKIRTVNIWLNIINVVKH